MELPLLARGELPQRSRKVGGNDGMADGGDHDVASMEGSGRGRRNFRRGAWRILGSGMEEFGIDGGEGTAGQNRAP
jgi:hypothetical protein